MQDGKPTGVVRCCEGAARECRLGGRSWLDRLLVLVPGRVSQDGSVSSTVRDESQIVLGVVPVLGPDRSYRRDRLYYLGQTGSGVGRERRWKIWRGDVAVLGCDAGLVAR